LALDKEGITVNNKGEVTGYKHMGINKPMKKNCKECGEMYEGEMCECGTKMYENKSEVCEVCGGEMNEGKMCECGGAGMKYSMEEIEESIKVKSKKGQNSLDFFSKLLNSNAIMDFHVFGPIFL
jgi:hypothetical protein